MNLLAILPSIPFTNPVLIFFIVLTIILLAPLLLNKLRIPHIIGLIIAGMLVGPNGLGLVLRDNSFEIFGKVGLLYLMFLAGLEMDINDFKKNKAKGITFGIYTFLVPMFLGTVISYYMLHFSLVTSVLLASMYASHTLVAYPIVSRYGISRTTSVTITIAGTIITVFLALLILAVITGMYHGVINELFWIRLVFSISVYCAFVIFSYPRITRWFLKKYDDNVAQYIFILALVFCASFLAELAGLESIIGAFLAGVVLNRFIPAVSPLMNRIEFVGNALFIPYFLIGVGMLIDLKVLFSSQQALFVAANMSIVATLSKWIAAWMTQKTFRLSKVDRNMIFGLSNGQAAATLAAVLIGHAIIIGTDESGLPIRLLNDDVLNGTIIMILVTCTISSFVTEKAARELVTQQKNQEKNNTVDTDEERILIPVANPSTIENLVNLALLLKKPKKKVPLYALFVTDDNKNENDKNYSAKYTLGKAAEVASATDNPIETISRYDLNIASGILHTIKEKGISEIVIGLHHKTNIVDTFFGTKTEALLKGTNKMVFISKCVIPAGTFTRIVIAVPEKAEYETGFVKWVDRIANIAKQVGCRAIFYAPIETLKRIRLVLIKGNYRIRNEFEILDRWEDLLMLTNVVLPDDLFVVVSARHTSISYNSEFDNLPVQLSRYFADNNLLLVYPEQFGSHIDAVFFSDPMSMDIQHDYTGSIRIRKYLKWLKWPFEKNKDYKNLRK